MFVPPKAPFGRRLRFWLPWISALLLVAGVVTFVIVYNVGGLRNTSKQIPTKTTNEPATQPAPLGVKVPLSKEVRNAAAHWIIASVARTNLARSWVLTAPDLRRGFTRQEWLTGNNPIIPYPLGNSIGGIVRVNWSTQKDASFEVTLVPRKRGSVKPQDFFINLRRYGTDKSHRWLVYYWGPREYIAVPDANASR
jgi:hypothetical protein